jgi:hypothetical protein
MLPDGGLLRRADGVHAELHGLGLRRLVPRTALMGGRFGSLRNADSGGRAKRFVVVQLPNAGKAAGRSEARLSSSAFS